MRKTRILVLGAYGMLGHDVFKFFNQSRKYHVAGTVKEIRKDINENIRSEASQIYKFDALQPERIVPILDKFGPRVIVNCIGDIYCRDFKNAFLLNSYLPQFISWLCYRRGIQLIHISTDGVFSGSVGNYRVDHVPDPIDDYGLTKAAGELLRIGVVFRTSLLGENVVEPKHGLIDWLIESRSREVFGFVDRIWSGVTTLELAKHILKVIDLGITGPKIFHVASIPISKYELLREIKSAYNLGKTIKPIHAGRIDRNLFPSPGFAIRKKIKQQLREYILFAKS